MLSYDITDKLRKKLRKITKKDKVLARIFKRKLEEVVSKDLQTINTYKNLKSPQNEFKRIHLTDNFILIFKVETDQKKVIFVDIIHWDIAYR